MDKINVSKCIYYRKGKMPHTPLTHEQFCGRVCAVCYCRSGSKATKVVTDRLEEMIRKLVFSDYSRTDSQFPSGLCLNCYFSLSDNSKGENTKNKNLGPRLLLLPESEKFDAELRRVTRSSSDSICQCRICVVRRLNGLEWRRFVTKFRKE